jgi:2-C-methyl-D-erythritol 4-phosphate cytidylyltransferase/2-C-methyl-D-erythritol 2,4-cyclodiphosphate synthase
LCNAAKFWEQRVRAAAVIVAAGRGERAAGGVPKQYRLLRGRPILTWSLAAFREAGLEQVIVVGSNDHAPLLAPILRGFGEVRFVAGGATRTDSVRAGLAAVSGADAVLIHDAARPGISVDIIAALIAALEAGAVGTAPALPVPDTLVRAGTDGDVFERLDRDGVMRVQTPQAFKLKALRRAYEQAEPYAAFSDDLAVLRAAGMPTRVIQGDLKLMKLTYPEDFAVLERLLAGDRITCVGHGVDAHRFGAGDHVTLCGVRIPHEKGLIGHSDADAGWHALVDAILGALGEGDIGAHFPPNDPQWKGADSERFLGHAAFLAHAAGARILHVDITILCERPKIGPHRDAMRVRTAAVLGLPLTRVSVKATTTERMGFLGREEGLAAQATATLDRPA